MAENIRDTTDKLQGFRIPRKQGIRLLTEIEVGSESYQELEGIFRLQLYRKSADNFLGYQLQEAWTIYNTANLKRYRDHTTRNPGTESFGFVWFDTFEDAEKVAAEGLRIGNGTYSGYADPAKGVTLCGFSDVLKRGTMKMNAIGYVLLVKYSVKKTNEGAGWTVDLDGNSNLDPPSDSETLMTPLLQLKDRIKQLRNTNELTIEHLFDLGQIYICPIGDSDLPPSVLPYAIVAYRVVKPVQLKPAFPAVRLPRIEELFPAPSKYPENWFMIHDLLLWFLIDRVKLRMQALQAARKQRQSVAATRCIKLLAEKSYRLQVVHSCNINVGIEYRSTDKPARKEFNDIGLNLEALRELNDFLFDRKKLDISAMLPASMQAADQSPTSTHVLQLAGSYCVVQSDSNSNSFNSPVEFLLHSTILKVCVFLTYEQADRRLNRRWFAANPRWYSHEGYRVSTSSGHSHVLHHAVLVSDARQVKEVLELQRRLVVNRGVLFAVLQPDVFLFAMPDSQYSQLLELPRLESVPTPYLHCVILHRHVPNFVSVHGLSMTAVPPRTSDGNLRYERDAELLRNETVRQFGLRAVFEHAFGRQRPLGELERRVWVGRSQSTARYTCYDYKKNVFRIVRAKFNELAKREKKLECLEQLYLVFEGEQHEEPTEDTALRTAEQLRICEAEAFHAEYSQALLGDAVNVIPDFGFDREADNYGPFACDSDSEDESSADADCDGKKVFTDDVFVNLAALLDTDDGLGTAVEAGLGPEAGSNRLPNADRLLRSFAAGHVHKPIRRHLLELSCAKRSCTRILAELTLRRNSLHSTLAAQLGLADAFSKLVEIEEKTIINDADAGDDGDTSLPFSELSLRNALLYVLRHPDAKVAAKQADRGVEIFNYFEPFYATSESPSELATEMRCSTPAAVADEIAPLDQS